MISWEKGRVSRIIKSLDEIEEIEVDIDGVLCPAWNFPPLTGKLSSGDQVYLNTTAVEKKLGSGGYHFVMANLSCIPQKESKAEGHIMKLRYTPYQIKTLSVEEEASPYHEQIRDFRSLDGTPVILGTLHSMLAPALAGCLSQAKEKVRVAYVMTDGAALPLALSNTVRSLKEKGMLCGTVSAGHAFGGDLESVNIYSGIIAAYEVLKAEIIIVTMGPGIVGTGTKWGTTALEQGEIVDAVGVLGGQPIAIPRISFADERSRHRGVSHHTLTALGRVARQKAIIPLPEMDLESKTLVREQLAEADIFAHHNVLIRDGNPALSYLEKRGITVRSMGRTPLDDPSFFLAAGAAGVVAVDLLKSKCRG